MSLFASIASDNDYDKQSVLNYIKPANEVPVFHELNIYQALSCIKRTAEGGDPIPYWFLKHYSLELAPIVTYLCNLILTQ